MKNIILETDRLILRPWKESDLVPFAQMNADPRVMEHFPSTLTKEESDQSAKTFDVCFQDHGWGLWAVSVPGVADFIGFIGLLKVPFNAHFTPAVEIGWRLAYDHWNKGYATEGAKASLNFGFNELKLDQIVSFTAVNNLRSRNVMEKIGMQTKPDDDFEHPRLPQGHYLRHHVLYRKKSDS